LLNNYYVADRKRVNEKKSGHKGKSNIPVTVRQLEAIIRLSEAIAKMSLSNTVNESHVNEAHRLFQISTLSAANSDFKSSYDVPSDLAPVILRVEEAIRRRMAIGSKVSYTKLIDELTGKYSSHKAIEYVKFIKCRRLSI
jgi:DNA replication licensing factor MCM5